MIFNVPVGQFGGPLRMGDLVALCNVIEHLRLQAGVHLQLYLEPNAVYDMEYCRQFFELLAAETDYFSAHPGNFQLAWSGINLWDYRALSRDLVRIDNHVHKTKKICLFPLFDARYNIIRNWPITLLEELIEEFSRCAYDDYERLVCASYLPESLSLGSFTLSTDFRDNLNHIRTCEVFIGGDTGTSHFAGALDPGPDQRIYYYSARMAVHVLPFHLNKRGSELRMLWWDGAGPPPSPSSVVAKALSMRKIALRDPSIGDALTAFPALYGLVDREEVQLWIGNPQVRDLWARSVGALLQHDPGADAEDVSVQMIYHQFHRSGLHMAQAWFSAVNLPIPDHVPDISLTVSPGPKEPIDVLISPISNSDAGTGLKLWSETKWCQVIDVLLARNLVVAVAGQFTEGKTPIFWGNRQVIAMDAPPLRDFGANLMSARCVVTVDNGIGHLAQFLRTPHVQLIPDHPDLSGRGWCANRNQNARVIHEKFALLSAERVLAAIFDVLSTFNIEAYLAANPDLGHAKPLQEWTPAEIWLHYVFCGIREGRTLAP
jgi:ADP-heptose:LPS heptosyltransferase